MRALLSGATSKAWIEHAWHRLGLRLQACEHRMKRAGGALDAWFSASIQLGWRPLFWPAAGIGLPLRRASAALSFGVSTPHAWLAAPMRLLARCTDRRGLAFTGSFWALGLGSQVSSKDSAAFHLRLSWLEVDFTWRPAAGCWLLAEHVKPLKPARGSLEHRCSSAPWR
jgi:hypothetical protein